jgi:hypothetical protein
MRIDMLVKMLIVSSLLVACVPNAPPVPPPLPEASDASWTVPDGGLGDSSDPAVQACEKLQTMGCPLGWDPMCVATLNLPPKFTAGPACVMAALTKLDLASCNILCR